MTPISIERMLSIIVAVILLGLSIYEAYKRRYRISITGFILTACTLFIIVPATKRIDQARALETGNRPVKVMQTNYTNQMNKYDKSIKHHKNLTSEGIKSNKRIPHQIASVKAKDPQVSIQMNQYINFVKKHPKKLFEYTNDANKMARLQTYGSDSPKAIDVEVIPTNSHTKASFAQLKQAIIARDRMKDNMFKQKFLKLMPKPISTFTPQDLDNMNAYISLKNSEYTNKTIIHQEKADTHKDQTKQRHYQEQMIQKINAKRKQMIRNSLKKYHDKNILVA